MEQINHFITGTFVSMMKDPDLNAMKPPVHESHSYLTDFR